MTESISRHATLDLEICLTSGSDDPRDLHLTAGRLVSLPDGKSHLVGTAPLTIGRGPSADIAVHSEDVSRGHAYLLRTPQGFLLVDSSLHGTYVNGERVQAQRLLTDGDVVQVGNHSFRFDLRRVEPSPTGQASPADLPETSQHPRTLPRDARATGKVGLALALTERSSWKARIAIWIRRYGPSELAGLALAFGGWWLMRKATGSAIAAAYGGSVGEALGFYGYLVTREMIKEAYFAGARRAPYGAAEIIRTCRGLLLEFGPAELLDTGLLRPLAMGVCTRLLGWGPGIVIGKLVADLAFYLPVIWMYERRRHLLSLAFAIALRPPSAAAQQRPCDDPSPLGPSRDLYCIELVPAPGITGVSGRVELGHIPGPFTVAVGSDGRPRYRLIVLAAGLPPPASLGSYRTYVAWVAPPTMDSMVSLGAIRNGRTRLGIVDLEKFTFLVTAEQSALAKEPSHRLVLRAQSPATRLYPPDLLQFSIGSMSQPVDGQHHDHGATRAGTMPASDSALRWTTVPMPAGLTMLPAEMALHPDEAAWLPSAKEPVPPVRARELIHLDDGDTLRLEAGLVRRTLKGRSYTMFAFNGQQPGPLIEVVRGSRVTVMLTNHLPQPTTVHWHGIRLENPNDGTPGMIQPAVPPGGEFTYRLRFPDAGIYWYHPHVREDIQQELGLYGNLLVRERDGDGHGAVNREAVLMLDDLLVSDAGMVPFGQESPTHALMGRFGNILLVNGEPGYRLRVKRGEVVRFFLTNAANARTLNLSFPGARMKVVASDVGTYEREEWVESVVIAPAERYVVQVRFERPGKVALVNRVRGLDHLYGRFFAQNDTLGVVEVARARIGSDLGARFSALRQDPATTAELEHYRRAAEHAPEKTLVLRLETHDLPPLTQRLIQLDSIYFPPVEWSGTMPMMNWASTGRQVRWILRDPETGKENMDIDWRFPRGEPVRIHLVNQRQSVHAMQHPIHLHGQRFLVLAVNGEPNQNLVWKDTVLVPAGSTVDILLDPSNPGRWMAHCHIAEHLSAGMMMPFTVE